MPVMQLGKQIRSFVETYAPSEFDELDYNEVLKDRVFGKSVGSSPSPSLLHPLISLTIMLILPYSDGTA